MRDVLILLVHLIVTIVRLMQPGGARSVVAEFVLLRHQLLVLNRTRRKAPNLRPHDRIVAGMCAGVLRPARLLRSAIVLKPATILHFHRLLVKRKYRELFSPQEETYASRAERPLGGTHCGHSGDEAKESTLWQSADRRSDCLGVRRNDQQGYRSASLRQTLSQIVRTRGLTSATQSAGP